jgi:hypothetical protein
MVVNHQLKRVDYDKTEIIKMEIPKFFSPNSIGSDSNSCITLGSHINANELF